MWWRILLHFRPVNSAASFRQCLGHSVNKITDRLSLVHPILFNRLDIEKLAGFVIPQSHFFQSGINLAPFDFAILHKGLWQGKCLGLAGTVI